MKHIPTPQQLLNEVCEVMQENPLKVAGRNRDKEIVKVRHYYAYIGRTYYKFKLKQLAAPLYRDHTTIINSLQVVKDWIDSKDEICNNDLEILKTHFEL
jgi:chromosomal replication initiation ATPase DnaA